MWRCMKWVGIYPWMGLGMFPLAYQGRPRKEEEKRRCRREGLEKDTKKSRLKPVKNQSRWSIETFSFVGVCDYIAFIHSFIIPTLPDIILFLPFVCLFLTRYHHILLFFPSTKSPSPLQKQVGRTTSSLHQLLSSSINQVTYLRTIMYMRTSSFDHFNHVLSTVIFYPPSSLSTFICPWSLSSSS